MNSYAELECNRDDRVDAIIWWTFDSFAAKQNKVVVFGYARKSNLCFPFYRLRHRFSSVWWNSITLCVAIIRDPYCSTFDHRFIVWLDLGEIIRCQSEYLLLDNVIAREHCILLWQRFLHRSMPSKKKVLNCVLWVVCIELCEFLPWLCDTSRHRGHCLPILFHKWNDILVFVE